MRDFYADDGGDREPQPQAEPGLHPRPEGAVDATSLTIEVDGELFALRPDSGGGTHYTWLSGPNPGYGFGLSPTGDLSLDEHRENIRAFLAMIDPSTGFIGDA
ncbi:hypothetical protein [Micromonospora sp. NPDC047134]|uniref:hypothetical protein n=1 Tax=Micromonospora sp. NPDC047134 TaxID=3154340 RepID=UPI0033F48412